MKMGNGVDRDMLILPVLCVLIGIGLIVYAIYYRVMLAAVVGAMFLFGGSVFIFALTDLSDKATARKTDIFFGSGMTAIAVLVIVLLSRIPDSVGGIILAAIFGLCGVALIVKGIVVPNTPDDEV